MHHVSRNTNDEEAEGDILDAVGALGIEWPVSFGMLDPVGRCDGAEEIAERQGRDGCGQKGKTLLVCSVEHVDVVSSM